MALMNLKAIMKEPMVGAKPSVSKPGGLFKKKKAIDSAAAPKSGLLERLKGK